MSKTSNYKVYYTLIPHIPRTMDYKHVRVRGRHFYRRSFKNQSQDPLLHKSPIPIRSLVSSSHDGSKRSIVFHFFLKSLSLCSTLGSSSHRPFRQTSHGRCLRQLSICASGLVKRDYEFKTASSHAPYFIEVEYLKRSTHSKPHKPFSLRPPCPKNKISYAISYYRRLHHAQSFL